MLGDDALVLDRHGIAREGHHARALAAMPGVEGKRIGLGRGFGVVAQNNIPGRWAHPGMERRTHTPSVGKPERLTRLRQGYGGLTPSVAAPLKPWGCSAFQSVMQPSGPV